MYCGVLGSVGDVLWDGGCSEFMLLEVRKRGLRFMICCGLGVVVYIIIDNLWGEFEFCFVSNIFFWFGV